MHQISTNVCPAEKHTKHSTDVTLPSSNLVNLTCIFLSARARYFVSKPNFWPCTRSRSWHLNTRSTSQACWKQGGRGGEHMPPKPYFLPCQIFGLHIITLPPDFQTLGHACLLQYTGVFYLAFMASRISGHGNIKRSPTDCLPSTVQRLYKFGVLKIKKVVCNRIT